jgi:hypothetical protein
LLSGLAGFSEAAEMFLLLVLMDGLHFGEI